MYYNLDKDKKPVPGTSMDFGRVEGERDYIIKQTIIMNVKISTIFLGLVTDNELFFETMIFFNGNTIYEKRYATYDEAIKGHEVAIAYAVNNIIRKIN